jgi:predicted nucleotidyltransferase
MGIKELLSPKRAAILALAALHGAENVRVFGSVARGDAGPQSDVDLLVRMANGRSLFDLIGFKLDVADLLGRDVDVLTEGGISPYLKDDILRGAVSL